MKRTCVHTLLLSALLWSLCALSVSPAAAAADEPIALTVALDRLEAEIGDVFTLAVTLDYDSSLRVSLPRIEKTLGDFEVQNVEWSPPAGADGRVRVTGEIKLWALELGEHEAPAIVIPYVTEAMLADSAAAPLVVASAPVVVTVLSVIDEADSAGIAPMVGPLDDPLALSDLYQDTDYTLPILGGALALLLAALWFFLWRKRRAELEPEDLRDPWEKAFERLAALSNASYLTERRHKEYYAELTNILKEFLGRVLSVPALDMTTNEALYAVAAHELTREREAEIRAVLGQADLVKFAKLTPPAERPAQDFDVSYSVIDAVKEAALEQRRLEEERRRLEAQASAQTHSEREVERV